MTAPLSLDEIEEIQQRWRKILLEKDWSKAEDQKYVMMFSGNWTDVLETARLALMAVEAIKKQKYSDEDFYAGKIGFSDAQKAADNLYDALAPFRQTEEK